MSHHQKSNPIKEYTVKTACFLAIMLAVIVAVIFIAIKPVTAVVHKIENNYLITANDIKLDDSTYAALSMQNSSGSDNQISYKLGNKVANISSKDFGLNTSVYFGVNRACITDGVCVSAKNSSILGDNKSASVVVGLLETYLSGLENAKKGDKLVVTTNYGEYTYKVCDIYYADSIEKGSESADNKLVIMALCSDFDCENGKYLCVKAEYAEKGAD